MTSPKRVLVVEDDLAIRNLLTRILGSRGYQVVTAADGFAALELAGDGFDLMLLDVGLPTLNGLEVCRQLRSRPATARLPILMLTGRDQPGDIRDGLAAGADDFLSKPFELAQLMARVERVLLPRTRAAAAS